MAGRGPIPKDPKERTGRFKETRRQVPVKNGDIELARPLPPGDWSVMVQRYWATFASCPQRVRYTATAWQRLEMLLPIVERYYTTFRVEDMREIRLNEALLGATPADMQRLKWDLVDIKPPAPKSDDLEPRRAARRVVDHSVAGGAP